jgi:excinuclease ABC subunit B
MPDFQLVSDFRPAGDQPQAIEKLVQGLNEGCRYQTLLGVTGSGKTFTMANVVERVQRPTLVISHNKTLAAQLYSEFREFFPSNAVRYFVSFYDYYQPEAYIPSTDTYIEKDMMRNEEIEKYRLMSTEALLTRRDVLIVASVSCIYGIGSPEEYEKQNIRVSVGDRVRRHDLLRQLIDIRYERNDYNFSQGTVRARGDVIEVFPAYSDLAYRIELFGDEVERIREIDTLTGEIHADLRDVVIFPAKHFMTDPQRFEQALLDIEKELQDRIEWFLKEGKLLEAQRIEQRTRFDLEMLRVVGSCNGIENYSRHFDGRRPGEPPYCLLNYFPEDYLVIVDESHVTIPQLRGMYHGDRSRKQTLVDYGFRLPSALDNRPLRFEETQRLLRQVIFVSATPGPYEHDVSEQIAQQVVRPTGLVDPAMVVRPTQGQIDDLIRECRARAENNQRVLVTTLTKRMAEDLTEYLAEVGLRVRYLHSEIDTLQRMDILRDLREGKFDVLVGINLLREGLDLPEVALVAILDADREGFLRSTTSLIQTAGRAARNADSVVLLYADTETDSIRNAVQETTRRRNLQLEFNAQHGITPRSIAKQVRPSLHLEPDEEADLVAPFLIAEAPLEDMDAEAVREIVAQLQEEMRAAAQALEFEKAAAIRDQIKELKEAHGV